MKWLHWFFHSWGPWKEISLNLTRLQDPTNTIEVLRQKSICKICGKIRLSRLD
jgi:hypothetical protein